ncbi:MAG: hypothetical protein CVV53_00075 [Spirochaetae bacterium HGW-Spirochaetae-9]|nr:MAG: hypothetical protein CVV53_00075 [Spirochaetae bacterium HGW-Spirochaetae-9]
MTTIMAVFFCAVAGIFFIDTLDMVQAANGLPRLLILLVIALSAGMVFESYKKSKIEALEEKASNAEDQGKPAFDKSGFIRLVLFVALIAAYVFLLKPVGYFIVTPLFIVAAFLLLEATSLLVGILTGIGFSVFVYFLFVVFLHLPVPMGILSGILG